MTTTPRLWKSQTQVNTTDGGTEQDDSQIVALQDGGYVVVWTDEDSHAYNPAGGAIVGQRYDAAGNKVGGEVKLSGFITGYQFSPAVTLLSDGNIAVAFQDRRSGDDDIYVRIFDPSLQLVRVPDPIDTGASQTFDPSITALAGGSYAISYTLQNGADPTNTDIVARIVGPTGTVGDQFYVDDSTGPTGFSEAATLSDGNFIVVNHDENRVFGVHTEYAIFSPTGALLGRHAIQFGGHESQADVAALRFGGVAIVWADQEVLTGNHDIRAIVLLEPQHVSINNDIVVNTHTPGEQNSPNVVALADGGFLVSWDDVTAHLVRAQRFDAVGLKIGSEFTVKDAALFSNYSPEAALLTDGRIASALDDRSSGDFDVVTSIWTTGWNAVATGDFNGDGTKDIIWQNAVGQTSEWLMSPSGGLGGNPSIPGSAGWNVVATGDFNGDGTTDLLWKNAATGVTSEWLMSNGGLASNPFTPGAQGWNVVATGDFNHDGTTDVVWKNAANGAISEWLMSPGGGIASNPFLPSAQGWDLAASGDFNGDGTADLMWKNAANGQVSEWLMNNGALAANPFIPGAQGWNLVATGDFNHDGTSDVLWQHASAGVTSEWLMAPTGGVGSFGAMPSAAGWNLVASGDFNGDGTADLLWKQASSGLTSEWLMSNGALAANPFIPGAQGWDVVSTGDFNGDAIIDIMWQNALNGATSEWLMSPGGGIGSNPLTPFT